MNLMMLYRLIPIIVLVAFVSGCSVESSDKPWRGYAINKRTGQAEPWWLMFESKEVCKETMLWKLRPGEENAQWYSKPIGCFYTSNSLIDAVVTNFFAYGKDIACYLEHKNPQARKEGWKYWPILKSRKHQCADTEDYVVALRF